MPSIDAPTHYERADSIMPENFDPFFRYLDLDEYVDEVSEVDSPLGWVGLLKVTEEVRDYVAASFAWPTDVPPLGWYIVRHNDQGIVWGMSYGEDSTFNEERARADFAEAERTYDRWVQIENEDY